MPRMMYKFPSINKSSSASKGFIEQLIEKERKKIDYEVFEDIESAKKEGWKLTPLEAVEAIKSSSKTEYRLKLEAMADKVGVKYAHNTKDETLYNKIKEASEKAK